MATSAIRTADGVRKFRNRVEDTIDDLQTQLKNTDAAIDEVAESWNDPQFKIFHEGFQEDKDIINRLCKTLQQWDDEVLYDIQKLIEKWSAL